jgi:hypothetical protein
MNGITNPPNEYSFGLDFNYALWTPGTRVTLANVPWNNDYRDIVKFANKAALNTYITSLETTGVVINNMSYYKPNQPIRIDVPFNVANRFNYLRASNPIQPITGDITKDFYYFITDVRYIAPNTTEVVVQLDVWQTFGFDITFGNSYIERGHIGIANTKAFNNYGRDYLTIPEGLDIGGEYQMVNKRDRVIMQPDQVNGANTGSNNVLVASTVDLEAEAGTADAPILISAKGSKIMGLPSGATYYVWQNTDSFKSFMDRYSNKPWVTQGIISITVIPEVRRYFDGFAHSATPYTGTGAVQMPNTKPKAITHNMAVDWRDGTFILPYIPARYQHLRKLFTYPYMVIEMTTFTGTPILIKPESWANDDARVIERAGLVPPNQRVTFTPYKYNARPGSPVDNVSNGFEDLPDTDLRGDDWGDFLDIATQVNNFPTVALVNNGAINYMASNSNSIAFQHNSADWSQQRALSGNVASYDNTTAGIEATGALNSIGVNADTLQTNLSNLTAQQNNIASGVGGILGGAGLGGAVGGPAGAGLGAVGGAVSFAGSAISTGINSNAAIGGLAIRGNASRAATAVGQGVASQVRDTNKALGDWAAKGDYSNAIASINAKVQDARLIQPTTSGQVGGESYNFVNDVMRMSIRWKLIDPAAMRAVCEYWLRYGYSVRQFAVIPAALSVMSKFTYWKLAETYITTAPMPEPIKQTIRGIFEKGVTVWSKPEFIGNTDIADNVPLGGFTL